MSNNENSNSKFSWETETQCDDFTQDIPTYSWEFDSFSPTDHEDSKPIEVPDSQWDANVHDIPKFSWESEYQCDEYTQDIPTYSWEAESCSPALRISPKGEAVFTNCEHKYGHNEELVEQKVVADDVVYSENKDVEPYISIETSNTYAGSTSHQDTDNYSYLDDSQRPESPNKNFDVDAIKIESIDSSPTLIKKSFWYFPKW